MMRKYILLVLLVIMGFSNKASTIRLCIKTSKTDKIQFFYSLSPIGKSQQFEEKTSKTFTLKGGEFTILTFTIKDDLHDLRVDFGSSVLHNDYEIKYLSIDSLIFYPEDLQNFFSFNRFIDNIVITSSILSFKVKPVNKLFDPNMLFKQYKLNWLYYQLGYVDELYECEINLKLRYRKPDLLKVYLSNKPIASEDDRTTFTKFLSDTSEFTNIRFTTYLLSQLRYMRIALGYKSPNTIEIDAVNIKSKNYDLIFTADELSNRFSYNYCVDTGFVSTGNYYQIITKREFGKYDPAITLTNELKTQQEIKVENLLRHFVLFMIIPITILLFFFNRRYFIFGKINQV